MKFELLLLFALVGSFCTITHASTLVVPTDAELGHTTEASMSTVAAHTINKDQTAPEDLVIITSSPAAEAAVEEIDAPSANTDTPPEETEVQSANTLAPVEKTVATSVHTELTETSLARTDAPVRETVVPVMENTDAGVVDKDSTATEGKRESPEVVDGEETQETGRTDTVEEPVLEKEGGQAIETDSDAVQVEDSEGMTTGHVVGIVLGALVAVVIIIAVIVVVVRRMGQYSP